MIGTFTRTLGELARRLFIFCYGATYEQRCGAQSFGSQALGGPHSRGDLAA